MWSFYFAASEVQKSFTGFGLFTNMQEKETHCEVCTV